MIWALPAILFYDEDKETQVYEDEEPDPIFKINVIKKFADTKLARYTNSYFQQVYKVFFDNFKTEIDFINDFVFEKEEKVTPPPTYIVDDTDEEEEKPEEIDEDEEEFGILDAVKGIWKLSKIYRMYKRIKKAIDAFRKATQWIRKQFRKIGKLFKWGKRKVIRWIVKARRYYRRVVQPLLKKFKRWLRKQARKLKKVLKRALKKLKKVVKRFLRRLKKKLGKIVKKFIKRFAKKALKRVIQQALKWIAGLFTGTGIGAVIGVAIFAAVIAWEAYDFAHDFADEISTEPNYPPQALEQETKPTVSVVKEKEIKIPDIKNIQEINETQILQYQNTIVDKVTLQIAKIGGLPHYIFASLYEFYKHCRVWLESKQTFLNKTITAMAEGTDQFFQAIVSWMNDQKITEFKDIIPTKPKDPNKVKKPNFTSEEKLMKIQSLIEKKERISVWTLLTHKVLIKNNYGGTDNVSNGERKARNLIASVLAGKIPVDIHVIDPNVKRIKLDEEIKGMTDSRREKIGALGLKNHLLFELYNRLVWIKESAAS